MIYLVDSVVHLLKIDDFIVVCSVTWHLYDSKAEVTLFWYRPHCFCCVNEVVLMLISCHLNKKSREVCIKARSPLALLTSMGQVTKHRILKWSIGARCYSIKESWPDVAYARNTESRWKARQVVTRCDMRSQPLLLLDIVVKHTLCNSRKYPYLPNGRDFFKTPPSLWKFQLSFKHFFKFFLPYPYTPGNSNPFCGGIMDIFWYCTLYHVEHIQMKLLSWSWLFMVNTWYM